MEKIDRLRRNLVLGGLAMAVFPMLQKIAQGNPKRDEDIWWRVNWGQYAGSVLGYLGLEPYLANHYFDLSRVQKLGGPSKRERDFNHLYPGDLVPLVMGNVPSEKKDAIKIIAGNHPVNFYDRGGFPNPDINAFEFSNQFYMDNIASQFEPWRAKDDFFGR